MLANQTFSVLLCVDLGFSQSNMFDCAVSSNAAMSNFRGDDVAQHERTRSLGLTAGTIVLLGFGEACLRCRRPVPLGLACRYALFNFIPSFVWRSIDMPLICRSAKASLADTVDASVLSEALRSVRYIVASYSALYHWLKLPHQTLPSEKVLRLTTPTSRLTPYSVRTHGDHVQPVEIDVAAPDVTGLRMQQWCLHQLDATRPDVFLLEVDLSSVASSAQAASILTSARHVVEPFRGPRAFARRMEAVVVLLTSPATAPDVVAGQDWDVCINTASIVSTHVVDILDAISTTAAAAPHEEAHDAKSDRVHDTSPVIVHTDSMDQFQSLASGLLQANRIPLRYRDDGSTLLTDAAAAVHVLAFQKPSSAVERLHVLLDQEVDATHICIVTDAPDFSAAPGVHVLHIPALCDQALQVIRGHLRCGMTTDEVQDSLRLRYGPMNSITATGFRRDKYSTV
ncbi:hypothetical protein, variant [Aphanomyces astaci]|uniref:Uncharacterized protein n=1 Tax=Aphanomyces astaci TaxID=112090 RepID=W4G7P0_APHAT|nr:hypothetical protein, variant [Aphanomyces astaci]ETV75727.1 hypothetical protein, variant [Aphanomyces astaci]|eukprot:XP_009834858.1 hypothetical protein, variant [Aphanomyces astaci]